MVQMQLVKGLEHETPQLEPYEVAGCSPNIFFPTNEPHKLPYVAVHLYQDWGHTPASAPEMAWQPDGHTVLQPPLFLKTEDSTEHSTSLFPGSASPSCLTHQDT